VNNTISGNGYNQVHTPTMASFLGTIDVSYGSTDPRIVDNK
jgi:hypothetical protein